MHPGLVNAADGAIATTAVRPIFPSESLEEEKRINKKWRLRTAVPGSIGRTKQATQADARSLKTFSYNIALL